MGAAAPRAKEVAPSAGRMATALAPSRPGHVAMLGSGGTDAGSGRCMERSVCSGFEHHFSLSSQKTAQKGTHETQQSHPPLERTPGLGTGGPEACLTLAALACLLHDASGAMLHF